MNKFMLVTAVLYVAAAVEEMARGNQLMSTVYLSYAVSNVCLSAQV